MPQAKSDQPAEWLTYFTDLDGESERATALLAGAFLNDALQQLIGRRLRRVDFAYRIEAAHELQLISDADRHDLRLVRQVRSEFAHRLDAHFNEPIIAAWCFELTAGRGILRKGSSPRAYFTATVALIGFALTMKRMQKKSRPPA